MGIASSSWQSVTQGRALTSSTNQVVADLRKAHSTASNRLVAQEVRFTASSNYQTPLEGGTYKTVSLPSEGAATEVSTPATLLFKPDGSVTVNGVAGTNTTIRVRLTNDNTKFNDIQVNASTSRVKIAP